MKTALNKLFSIKHFLTLLLLTQMNSIVYSQWQFKSGNDDIDGKYKTSYVIGKGEFPYNKPMLVINTYDELNLNIYLSDAGYAGCQNLLAIVKFDKENTTRKYSVTTNTNKDTWFIKYEYSGKSEQVSNYEFLQNLKSNNYVTIRLCSDCSEKDFKFSLAGSSKAVTFVADTYIQKVKKRLSEIDLENKKKNESIIEFEKRNDELFRLKKDSLVRRIADKRILIFDQQDLFGLKTDIFIENGDTFKVSLINKGSQYYRLQYVNKIDVSKFDSLFVKISDIEEIK